jgi:hypothetical protein
MTTGSGTRCRLYLRVPTAGSAFEPIETVQRCSVVAGINTSVSAVLHPL